MKKQFVTYLRVSTTKQGQSGLGLEAQKTAVESYLSSVGGRSLAEFVEVESGRKNERVELQAALALCKAYGATLLVASLDRLARNAHFLLGLSMAPEYPAIRAP
jgi:DNA invertase Pin-like site-specific DNA recombinase